MSSQISHRHIWHLAWPMILGNLSVPILGIVDTAILGHLDQPIYLAAVALGASIITFVFWAFGFLRMGTTSFVAQAHGAGNQDRYQQVVGQSIFLAWSIALLVLVVHRPLLDVIFWAMKAEASLVDLATEYTRIRILGAPAVMVNYVIIGIFIGLQKTRIPLLLALVVNGINIVLDYVLIILLEMNSQGAALATVIADYSVLILGLWFLSKHFTLGYLVAGWRNLIQWQSLKDLVQVNRHLFVRTASLLFVFLFIAAQGAKQGEVILAANAILLQLLSLAAYGMDGFAHATETLVGHSVGKRSSQTFWSACRRASLWSLITALFITAIFVLFKPLIVSVFTDIESVRDATLRFYPWLIVLPLISVWSYQLDGIFIGMGESKALQWCMLFSLLCIFLPVWYFTTSLANHGLWMAFVLFNAMRGVSLAWMLWRLRKRFD